jgi:Uri superfamily endonuclease
MAYNLEERARDAEKRREKEISEVLSKMKKDYLGFGVSDSALLEGLRCAHIAGAQHALDEASKRLGIFV